MLRIADKTFDSHLFTGTGKFASSQLMVEAIRASGSQLVTLAMKRVDLRQHNDAILEPLIAAGVTLLPNTSGAKTAEEAIFAAHLAREALGTNWLKLEIHPDARWLLPIHRNSESRRNAGTTGICRAALLRGRSGIV